MSDSVGYTPGVGAEIAVDEIAGIKHQRVKMQFGADGVATDVSAANPMPVTAPGGIAVTGALTDAELRAAAVPVSGPLTDGQLRAVELIVSDTRAAALLFQLVQLLMFPPGFDRSLNRARGTVLVESGTVSAVSALTDQTNIGGRPAQMLINQTNLSAWADCVRARIT
jgi:hypothetical protein